MLGIVRQALHLIAPGGGGHPRRASSLGHGSGMPRVTRVPPEYVGLSRRRALIVSVAATSMALLAGGHIASAADNVWGPYTRIGPETVKSVSATSSRDGRLDVFGVSADNTGWLKSSTP